MRATLNGGAALSADAKNEITDALRLIDVMIEGGQIDPQRQTKGLLSFFRSAAWQNGVFVEGGLADAPGQNRDWVPATQTLAVDVQTWGIAALGTKQIDGWFGYGASFELWQRLKTWGGYGVGKTLWGVGYSDKDGNGIDQAGAYRQGLMSAEGAAGAINAVCNMLCYYGAEAPASSHYSAAKTYAARLKQDEAAMLTAIEALRIDQYAKTEFPGKPADYAKLLAIKPSPIYTRAGERAPF